MRPTGTPTLPSETSSSHAGVIRKGTLAPTAVGVDGAHKHTHLPHNVTHAAVVRQGLLGAFRVHAVAVLTDAGEPFSPNFCRAKERRHVAEARAAHRRWLRRHDFTPKDSKWIITLLYGRRFS